MDFRTLQYFYTVGQELNITRAAQKLNMSQPPLSMQMKNLEAELGVCLFVRNKRRLELTEAGSLLMRRTEQMLALADKTRSELGSLEQSLSGTICIGTVEGLAPYLTARWIKGFSEEFPLVNYQLRNGSSDEVLEYLHRGLVDLAVIARPYDREHLEGVLVGREPWVALIPKEHPLAEREGSEVPLADLAKEQLIIPSRSSRVEEFREWFAGVGAEPRFLVRTANYLDAMALAQQGVGICIFPETTSVPHPRVVSKRIVNPGRMAEYELVTEKGQPVTTITGEFINFVRDTLEEEKAKDETPPLTLRCFAE